MSEDAVYVERLLALKPLMHLLKPAPPPNQDRGYWATTQCEQSVSFRSECGVMRLSHASKFAEKCEECFKWQEPASP